MSISCGGIVACAWRDQGVALWQGIVEGHYQFFWALVGFVPLCGNSVPLAVHPFGVSSERKEGLGTLWILSTMRSCAISDGARVENMV